MESEGQGPSPLDWHSLFPWTPWSMRPHRPGAEASPLQTGTRELGIGAHVLLLLLCTRDRQPLPQRPMEAAALLESL